MLALGELLQNSLSLRKVAPREIIGAAGSGARFCWLIWRYVTVRGMCSSLGTQTYFVDLLVDLPVST